MPQLKLWLLPAPAVGWTGCYLIPEQLTVTLLQGIMSGDSKEETFQLCWLKISLLTHHWSMAGEVGAWPCKPASCCPQNLRVSTKELIPWLKIFCTMYLSLWPAVCSGLCLSSLKDFFVFGQVNVKGLWCTGIGTCWEISVPWEAYHLKQMSVAFLMMLGFADIMGKKYWYTLLMSVTTWEESCTSGSYE